MSGIYLVLWDPAHKHQSPVLHSTRGGYPHLTVAYTGKELSVASLKQVATNVFAKWALDIIILEKAVVFSFEDRTGQMRHDVIIMTKEREKIEETRELYLKQPFANHQQFTMRVPHVTFGAFETAADAEKAAWSLNHTYLPYGVVVTGVTID